VNRLYHFTTAKYAFDDLRNRRLKIAQLDDLNDPFELKSVNLCNPTHAQAFDGTDKFEGFKAEMARRFGVLCFSEDKADLLQWAHYADRHREFASASTFLEAKKSSDLFSMWRRGSLFQNRLTKLLHGSC
jgi:hypothetical protein